MTTLNAATSALFDVLLAPFGHGFAWFDLVLWPTLAGVLALFVYKHLSDQKGIERAKDRIAAHLYEIRLFRHDPIAVLVSTAKIFARNAVYLGYNLVPLAVLGAPMLLVIAQLEANYAFDPSPVGSVELLEVKLDPRAAVRARDVALELPDGVALDAPPVRTPDGEIYWRLRAERAGDQPLTLRAGDEVLTKTWSIGGPQRKVATLRTKGWESLLYPGEPALPARSAFESVSLPAPPRAFPFMPAGELGVLAIFFVVSLGAGFALKGRFGVTF